MIHTDKYPLRQYLADESDPELRRILHVIKHQNYPFTSPEFMDQKSIVLDFNMKGWMARVIHDDLTCLNLTCSLLDVIALPSSLNASFTKKFDFRRTSFSKEFSISVQKMSQGLKLIDGLSKWFPFSQVEVFFVFVPSGRSSFLKKPRNLLFFSHKIRFRGLFPLVSDMQGFSF
jgi:hypothetical protein